MRDVGVAHQLGVQHCGQPLQDGRQAGPARELLALEGRLVRRHVVICSTGGGRHPYIAQGWGRIVFISSESGVDVPADMVHYGVSKAALLALGNGLAKLTRGTQVTVNSVVGGPTCSDGVASAVRSIAGARGVSEEEMKAAIAQRDATSLVQRFLDPAELASLVAYLASPLSAATNGSALRADGGTLAQVL